MLIVSVVAYSFVVPSISNCFKNTLEVLLSWTPSALYLVNLYNELSYSNNAIYFPALILANV